MTLEVLFRKYLDDQLTAEELRLFREMATDPENRAGLDKLLALWVDREFPAQEPENIDIDAFYLELSQHHNIPMAEQGPAFPVSDRRPRMVVAYFARYVRWAAAVAILVVAAFLTYRRPAPKPVTAVAKPTVAQPAVIAPAASKAILTLANGSQIVLDSAADGQLTSQGNTQVIKKGGQLAYQTGQASAADPLQYNQINTPRGGFYELILPDGSKVWLDAASSLRYPTAFTGKTRSVELTGEAYFEVSANPQQPFLITSQRVTVQVLGTELNLMAYTDEDAIRTTLVSGALRVIRGDDEQQIRPGEQASWSREGSHWQVSTPDMKEVLAWKKGEFRFEDMPIAAIMRQIARWYDVDIEFRGPQPTNEFNGVIPRKKSVTELLTVLEQTDAVHFTLQGRTIIVEAGGR